MTPARVPLLIYGSCVSRDTYEHGLAAHLRLDAYVARQSLVSAYSPPRPGTPDLGRLAHAFQRRVVAEDFAGSLPARLDALPADRPGLVLWDLVDERLGVYAFADGSHVTRSVELVESGADAAVAAQARHLPFGSDAHLAAWSAALERFAAHLARLAHVRLLVLDTPWAATTDAGDPAPTSFGVDAATANRRTARYVAALAGLPRTTVLPLDPRLAVSGTGHRWGAAPFHYAPAAYDRLARDVLAASAGLRGDRAPARTTPPAAPTDDPAPGRPRRRTHPMTTILMRAGKSPFRACTALETLRHDPIGRNSGNLMFAGAVHRLLNVAGTEVSTRSDFGARSAAAEINDAYDGFALPLANCFRPSFEGQLRALTRVVRGLDIPVVMLSGGAQVEDDDPGFAALRPIEETVRAFCAAVLDRSSHLTVRGERTAEYLGSLGFRDVRVIGCPSLTMAGREHRVRDAPAGDLRGARVAYSVETSKDLMGPTIDAFRAAGARLTYVPQDRATLEMLVWGVERFAAARDRRQPVHLDHPELRSGDIRFFLDARTWIDFLSRQELSLGPRIHGAVAAVLAGTPALLVGHDARTRELAAHHRIPVVSAADLAARSPEELAGSVSYDAFHRSLAANVDLVVEHARENGFATTLDPGREADRRAYATRLARAELPPAVSVATGVPSDRALVAELREAVVALERQVRRLSRP